MSKKIHFTPGPSALYFTAEEHIKSALKHQVAEISHRSSTYKSIHEEAVVHLRALLGLPAHFHIAFVASATEIWERLIQNLVAGQSMHMVNGAFSKRFYEVAGELGRERILVKAADGHIPDANQWPSANPELVALVQNETSTGVALPEATGKMIREKYPNAIIALDIVSSCPAVPVDFDMIDTAYFSVQKCFGLPAGLGVWIYNDRCLAKVEAMLAQGHSVGSYHALHRIHETGVKFQTPETPNVLNIYLLAKVAGDMLAKSIDQIRRETNYKAAVLYQLFEDHPLLSAFAHSSDIRSKTVAVAQVQGGSEGLIKHLTNENLIVGSGYGEAHKNHHIRIANFPTHSKEQIELLADTISKYG